MAKCQIIIPFEYQSINQTWYNNFSGIDTFIVQKNDKLGTIDFKNNVVIPIEYDGISGWVEWGPEAHYVKKDGKYGLLAHNGNLLIPVIYDDVFYYSNNIITVKNNEKKGIVNIRNQVIIPCIYDEIILDIDFWGFKSKNKNEDQIIVKKNNIWTYMNLKGDITRKNVPNGEIIKKYATDLQNAKFADIDPFMIFNVKEKKKHSISR